MASCTFIACLLAIHSLVCAAETQISIKTAEMTRIGSSLVKIPHELELPSVEEKEYKILSGEEYVNVDQNTGVLTVAGLMDREKICQDNRPKCYVDIAVVVLSVDKKTSPTSLRIVKIQIEVTDINDNVPKFENHVIQKFISEGIDVPTSIRLDSAVDPDLDSNSIQRYALKSSTGARTVDKFFKLGVIENIDGTKIPRLELKRTLDREKQDVHELILEAIDGGTPALTGTAIVRINVTDSNDNRPAFEEDVYVVKVDEHEKNNSIIIKMHAEDKDAGLNGMIRYKFPSVVSTEDQEVFALNSETGEISVKNSQKLDFEFKKIHHLTIEATDLGPNSASAYATVTVQVQDINDNKPVIDVSFMELKDVFVEKQASDYDAVIREDIDVGSYVAFVTITDKDNGKNGSVSCKIPNNDVFDLQSIEENTSRFLLKVVTSLDREERSFYDVVVEAWDHGTPPQRSRPTVRIKVGDVNDNAPAFIHDEFTVGVSETASVGTIVMTLLAKDLDESPGPNSEITYKLLSSDDVVQKGDELILLTDIFEIGRDSGEIRLVMDGVLDAETVREPGFLTVLASDNGTPALNTTTRLKITTIDENDNPPIFEKSSYVFHIKEHSSDGFYVGQVKANDADRAKDSNGRVVYYAERYNQRGNSQYEKDEEEWLQMFQINGNTGFIHFYGNKTKLDREARNGRPVTIIAVASDNGTPRQTARARVDIFLTDINDNAPVVTYPNVTRDVAFVEVPLRLSASTSEHTSKVGEDYREKSADARGKKTPEGDWSAVTVIDSSNYEAGDLASPTLVQLDAVDPDSGENAQMSFTIVEGNPNGYFQASVEEGNISFAPGLDLNNLIMGCHVLKILVKDLGTEQKSSVAYINVFLSRSGSNSVNKTEAMQDCQSNSLYPHAEERSINMASLDKLTIFIIIGFSVLIFTILVIIVVIIIKCKCCNTPNKSRTYNCQQRSSLYSPSAYTSASERKKKKSKKSSHTNVSHSGLGTVDSRSSFHSEWTASQKPIAQERPDMVGALPPIRSEESVGSHNSGCDSGTGDSMPSDAYHMIVPRTGEMGYQLAPYTQLGPAHLSVGYHAHHPTSLDEMDERTLMELQQKQQSLMMTVKCTEDCLVYGHSDSCWMPDSLLRSPSHINSFSRQEADNGKSPVRNLNHLAFMQRPIDEGKELRYQNGDPSTPYYYDPGRKFVHLSENNGVEYPAYQKETGGHDVPIYQEGIENGYEGNDGSNQYYPSYNMQHRAPDGSSSIPQASSSLNSNDTSRLRHNMEVANTNDISFSQPERGNAYVNLQHRPVAGTPRGGQNEDSRSNLSSESGNTNKFGGVYAHGEQPFYHDPRQTQMRFPVYQNAAQPNNYYEPLPPGQSFVNSTSEFHPAIQHLPGNEGANPYEDDFSASNLLSPVDNESKYRPDWTHHALGQPKAGFLPADVYSSNMPSQASTKPYTSSKEADEEGRLLGSGDARAGLDATTQNQEDLATSANEKLCTIEEIDAEAVVAEIDGLLL